jgi:hypothetical protein
MVIAILGLSANEERFFGSYVLLEGRWIEDDTEPAILMNRHQATELGVSIGDYVLFNSMKLNVIGIYDGGKADNFIDLDGNPISPIDKRRSKPGEPPIYMPFDELVIIPQGLLYRLGAPIMAISVVLPDSSLVVPSAEDLAQRFMVGCFASYQGNVAVYTHGGMFQMLGAETLTTPFVIAALIMVNLMLGAVYERRREIGILGSLGLSPTHVSLMFLGEAVVYGVLGVTIGYIVGVSLGVTTYTGGLFPTGFTPNFSSISVIITIGFVIISVLISTLYPTSQASKMMTPSLERKWKIPTKPVGGKWIIPMPLSVPEASVNGVLVFMDEFVRLHTRRELGGFVSSNRSFKEDVVDGKKARLLSFEAHLAPFEKGVKQRVDVIANESQGTWMFQVIIIHMGGELGDWQKHNRVFIDSLKKQLLLWTLQPAMVREKYIAEGNKIWRTNNK